MYSVEPVVKDEEGGEGRKGMYVVGEEVEGAAVLCSAVLCFVPEVMILATSPGTAACSWSRISPEPIKAGSLPVLWNPPNPCPAKNGQR